MHQIYLPAILIGITCLGVVSVASSAEPVEPLIGVNAMERGSFAVAVLNRTGKPISLGELDSALGFDPLRATIKTVTGTLMIKRKQMRFTRDVRRPIVIPSGSYHEFTIDLSDSTWDFGGHKAENDPASWKSIQILYRPQACALVEDRKQKGILETPLESMWVNISDAKAK